MILTGSTTILVQQMRRISAPSFSGKTSDGRVGWGEGGGGGGRRGKGGGEDFLFLSLSPSVCLLSASIEFRPVLTIACATDFF